MTARTPVAVPRVARRRAAWLAALASIGVVVVVAFGFMLALGGGQLGCLTGAGAAPGPSSTAVREIAPRRVALYRAAGAAIDIDWAFLASIGAQECGHRRCAGTNPSGCAGPMQIAVRRGSPCSPGSGPTLWETYGTDADHDGRADVNDPADAILTAAKILRHAKGAPPAGGSYAAYRQAACNYYGACQDPRSDYAHEVMARAVAYGFRGPGTRNPTAPAGGDAAAADCAAAGDAIAENGALGPVRRLRGPRRLAALSPLVVAPGHGRVECDARIVANVEYLARRYRVWVTACYAIHSPAGEHPLGAAIDAVPADGDWARTMRLARALGWRPACAASGLAPACARPPFRAVLYNGFPGHGDPAHCLPCGGGPHLHLSWQTSASAGQPENAPRTSYFPPSWVDTFTAPASARPARARTRPGRTTGRGRDASQSSHHAAQLRVASRLARPPQARLASSHPRQVATGASPLYGARRGPARRADISITTGNRT